jgi:hypothetical protein
LLVKANDIEIESGIESDSSTDQQMLEANSLKTQTNDNCIVTPANDEELKVKSMFLFFYILFILK